MNSTGSKEEHQFFRGDRRSPFDPFKSEWRIDLERRMAEDALKPRPIVKQAQIVARQSRTGPHNSLPRKCEVCGNGIRKDNKSGRCGLHRPFLQMMTCRGICPYTGCGTPLNIKNKFGICIRHYHKFRRLLKQTEVRVCAEPECFKSLYKSCKLTRCRKHARAERTAQEVIRMRVVRARRRELRKAA